MTTSRHLNKGEEPSAKWREGEENATPNRAPVNYFALASLLTGSLALVGVSIPFLKILAIILGGAGLILGLLGLVAHIRQKKDTVFSLAGISASILAGGLGTITLIRGGNDKSLENRLTQVPLHNQLISASSRNSAEIESDWADAGTNAVQQGDVRVRLISIAVGPVDFKETSGPSGSSPKPAQKRPREKFLVIKLRISNAGAGRLIQYSGWSHPSPKPEDPLLSLTDGGGKVYPLKVFPPGREVVGQVSNASIPPSKWVDDVLLFDAPPGRVQFLRLELPGDSVGIKGSFRLQIPGRMIGSR